MANKNSNPWQQMFDMLLRGGSDVVKPYFDSAWSRGQQQAQQYYQNRDQFGNYNDPMSGWSQQGNAEDNFQNGLGLGGQNVNAGYQQLIDSLQGTDFTNILSNLGLDTGSMSGAQREDWNKQILDSLLQYISTLENRQYNEGLRDEQRIYDSPTNQLARLMGAGLSRDAAIQLMSAAGGSSGSGVPYSDPAAMSQGIPATQSDLNNIQKYTSVFGTIAQIAGAVGSLGSFGISAASLSTNLAATKAATAGQLLSNTQFKKTLAGIETASTVIGAISSAYSAGVIDKDHEFSSAQEMVKYIDDNADKFEPFGNLKSSGALNGIMKDVYSLDALNHGYQSWRQTRDYNVDRKHIVNMQALNELFGSINLEKVQTEILQGKQQIQESIANVLNSTKLANAQVQQIWSATSKLDAETDLLHQQFDAQQMELDWLTANIEDLNSVRTNQLMLDAAKWNALSNDPKAYNAEIQSWLQDKANLRSAIAIESYYYANRLSATYQLQQSTIPLSDLNFAQLVSWFHNIFSQSALVRPGSATQNERDLLGNLEGSQVALWALRKMSKLP